MKMRRNRHQILFLTFLAGVLNLCMAQSKYSIGGRLGYEYDRLSFSSIKNESDPSFESMFRTKAHSAVISLSVQRNITIKSKKIALGIFGDFFRTVSGSSSFEQSIANNADLRAYPNNQLGTYFLTQSTGVDPLTGEELLIDSTGIFRPIPRRTSIDNEQPIDNIRRPLYYNNPRVKNKSSVFNFGGYISIPIRISDKSSFQCRPGIGVSYNKIHYEIRTEDIVVVFPSISGIPPSAFPELTIEGRKYEVKLEQWVMIPKMEISYIYKIGSRMSMDVNLGLNYRNLDRLQTKGEVGSDIHSNYKSKILSAYYQLGFKYDLF